MADHGLLVGVVVDLNDPEKLGRVKVSYPELGDARSDWARLVTLMAGKHRGAVFRPEKGDEVLVGFLQGDPRAPYVLGGVWSAPDPPPPDDGKPAENNWRFITSRSGHVIRFDDTRGKEKIEIVDRSAKRRVTIDSARRRIRVEATEGDVEISAPAGTIRLSAKAIELDARTTVKVEGERTVEIGAATSVKVNSRLGLSLSAGTGLTIRGATVDIN
ncbi:phage baseplate assembly protein V [Streptoalloteichus hindustanus]|uniref:Type VI secretion system, phage-baseplate injector n=1 Tax=Streptoalloteichus hindustanus TaxID=2017 RepID=A0A1M5CMR7_STRHI|nr:phage baseplate assembly protein V [Streptoalloteichus hindustanus]SHF55712.1 Type VI secretion system, phage-baseplate injector [Streptoalloteichus hindustanus]